MIATIRRYLISGLLFWVPVWITLLVLKFLIDLINNKLNNKVIIPDITLIDYKESIIFGFLGVLKMLNINNCYSSVTGSSIDHCSGEIFLP